MSNILDLLNQIKTAIYGRDVRQAIHDAIRQCYDDGHAGSIDPTARELIASQIENWNSRFNSFKDLIEGRQDAYEEATTEEITEKQDFMQEQIDTFVSTHGAVSATLITETTLFEINPASGPEAEIDISQQELANYRYIDIYYKIAGTNKRCVRVTPDMLAAAVNLDPIAYSSGEKSIIMYEPVLSPNWNGTKIILTMHRWAWNGAASAAATLRTASEPAAGIYKVVGIKHISKSADKDAELSDLRIALDGTVKTTAGQMVRGEMQAINNKIGDKVSKPETSPNGTSGQVLRTNGDGTTEWVDIGIPTDEQAEEAIVGWLNNHPEATTTVLDGSITGEKLHNGAVSLDKLATDVEQIIDDTGFYDEVTVETGTYTNSDGDKTNYYMATVPKNDRDGNQIGIYAAYDPATTPLTYAQKNLTTLTINSSLDFHENGERYSPAVIHNGEVVREYTFGPKLDNYDFVVYVGFDSNRVPHEYPVTTPPQDMIDDGIVEATAAFFRLVDNGEAVNLENPKYSAALVRVNPRMCMFTRVDGSICFLACDGRENIDEGLTLSELADLIISLGAIDAWNIDGGGSTSMVTCGSKINRNIDDNGTKDRAVRVTWNVGRKYENTAIQKAIVHTGIEKQRLIKQLLTYLSNGAAPVQNQIDPESLDGGLYYVNNATGIPTSINDGFVHVFKKDNSEITRIHWYPYNSDDVWTKRFTGTAWTAWTRSFDLLALGESIPSNSDLNDYTTPGKYRIANASISETISNIPHTGSGGTIYVFCSNSNSVVIQLYFGGNGVAANRRIVIGETVEYGQWTKFSEIRHLAATYTTDENGDITFSVGVTNAVVLAMNADGYVVLPYMSGNNWKGKVLNASLQPVTNTSLIVNTEYSIRAFIRTI